MTTEQINMEALAALHEARERAIIDIDVTKVNYHMEVEKILAPFKAGYCTQKDMLLKLNHLHMIIQLAKNKLHDTI